MSSSGLIRWGALAAILAGVVFIVNGILAAVNPSLYQVAIFVVAVLLMLAGLVGFHVLQKENYGRVGRAGFYTIIVASLVQILGLLVILARGTALEWLIPIGSLGVLVGFVLYGAATLQARVLPRWCGVALIVALPVSIPFGLYGSILFGIIWLALGYVLWSRRGTSAEQPSRVS